MMKLEYNKCWEDGEEYYEILTLKGKRVGIAWSLRTARLFAAAPEMLELVERLQRDLESGDDSIYDRDYAKKVNQVISEAKGEAE